MCANQPRCPSCDAEASPRSHEDGPMNTKRTKGELSMDTSQGPLTAVDSSMASAPSPAVVELQRRIPALPVGYPGMGAPDVCSPDGARISLFLGDRCVATGTVFPAERSILPQLTGLRPADLGASVGIGEICVDPTA